MADLNVNNFVHEIKIMQPRDRKHLRAEDLIKLILQLTDSPSPDLMDLSTKVNDILASMAEVQKVALENSHEIIKLKDSNSQLVHQNADLSRDVIRLNNEYTTLKNQMDSTDQYLRINNLEIVGLDNPGENETMENLILECLNGLNPENEVVSADIDICHALPSKKQNDQKTHIVRFISRKSQSNILSVNKEQRNRVVSI